MWIDLITKDHRGLDQAHPASSQPGHRPYKDHDDGDGGRIDDLQGGDKKKDRNINFIVTVTG